MAKHYNKQGNKGSFKRHNKNNERRNRNQKQNEEETTSSFNDAVLDARKFLNKRSNDDPDSDLEFNDEELDSDDALGSEDDLDDYMANKNKSNENTELNEYGEEENGWESVDEGDLMTLSELWDNDDKEIKSGTKKNIQKNEIVFNDEDEENSSDSDEDSDSSESDSEEEEEEDDDENDDPFDEMNLSSDEEVKLGSVLKNLKSKLPKTEQAKKLLINDKTVENEFSLSNQGDSLTFDDMLEDMDYNNNNDEDDTNENNNDDLIRDIVKQSKKAKESKIQDTESDDETGNEINTHFAIPLPVNIQKRHERRAAYEIQKEQVNRWREIIAENREKDVLKFIPEKVKIDNNAAFKTDNEISINDFESKLDSIINQNNLESKKTEDLFENIETAKLSKAEMLKRTNELRLMRELMYRGMKDSKRLKKIKSRAYRKQLRKDKMKEEMLISQVNRQEGIEDEENEDDDPLYQRAKERMSLKHKNTSKWAKQMVKSNMSKDKSTRDEMEEMMRQGENLRLKQLGKTANESSDDERDLTDLEKDVINMKEYDDSKLSKIGKGVLAMDFMKNAAEREKLIKLKEIENLKKFNDHEEYQEFVESDATGVNIALNSGRRVYTPSALVAAEEARKVDEELLKELDEDDAKSLKNRLASKDLSSQNSNKRKRYYGEEFEKIDDNNKTNSNDNGTENEINNPWLDDNNDDNSEEEEDGKNKSSNKLKIIDERSSKLDKSGAKIAKKLSKRTELLKKESNKQRSVSDDISINNQETLKIIDPKKTHDNNKSIKDGDDDDEYESDGNDQDDIRMFRQTDLIKQAFAGDDILVEEFETEKREIEEDDDDKEVNLTVPGWGSWAGSEEGQDDGWGVPKNNKKRKIVKTIQGVVNKDKRLDRGKKGVIINEKVNKKNNKYQADKVPYPYKTWEEYERSLRTPLGKEWSSTRTHQKMITPKVITRFGAAIDPLKAPFTQ